MLLMASLLDTVLASRDKGFSKKARYSTSCASVARKLVHSRFNLVKVTTVSRTLFGFILAISMQPLVLGSNLQVYPYMITMGCNTPVEAEADSPLPQYHHLQSSLT